MCLHTKPRSAFYPMSRGRGAQSYCKSCERARRKHYEKTHVYKETKHKWASSEAGRISQRKWQQKTYATNPEKSHAHCAVHYALKTGKLIRQPCEICGFPQAEAHHDDYSRPLDVRWLCRRHHADLHPRGRKEDAT